MLHLFYHVWMVNHWRELVIEQIARIQDGGLADQSALHIGAIGSKEACSELAALTAHLSPRLTYHGEDPEQFEFPTLELLRNHCATEEGPVCYFHTKGVSYQPHPMQDYWRGTMNGFIVGRWQECTSALNDGAQVAGVRWRTSQSELPHAFAGNFWWARCDYIRSLPDFVKQHRYECENWLLSGNPSRTFEHRVDEPLF